MRAAYGCSVEEDASVGRMIHKKWGRPGETAAPVPSENPIRQRPSTHATGDSPRHLALSLATPRQAPG
jgi:hypothetical protein